MDQTKHIAKEISFILPIMIRNVFPYTFQLLEVPPSQALALAYIYEKGPCHAGDLSRAMHIAAPTVSGIVDRLEKNGYLKRLPDKDDRRAVTVSLTLKGEKIVHKLRQSIMERWMIILKTVPPEDQENILMMLKKIIYGLTKDEKQP